MGFFDRFVQPDGRHSAWIRLPTQAETASWRLPAVLALSLVALLVVLVGAPGSLGVLLVGAFMLVAPGLLLAELLRVGDGLLSLVLAMMAGPVLWVVLPTVEVFVGAWHPEVTVGVVAVVLAVVAAALLVRRYRATPATVTQPRLPMPVRAAAPVAVVAAPAAEPQPAKKTTAKKTSATRTPAKKTPARKTTAKKAAAKKAPADKAAAKKAMPRKKPDAD